MIPSFNNCTILIFDTISVVVFIRRYISYTRGKFKTVCLTGENIFEIDTFSFSIRKKNALCMELLLHGKIEQNSLEAKKGFFSSNFQIFCGCSGQNCEPLSWSRTQTIIICQKEKKKKKNDFSDVSSHI